MKISIKLKPVQPSKPSNINFPNPPIKWVGGKTQLLSELMPRFPATIATYYEPFVGGGSVLLAVLSLRQQGKLTINRVVAGDINPHLINMYTTIRDQLAELITELTTLKTEYLSITELNGNRRPISKSEALVSRESYYYWQREQFNQQRKLPNLTTAALMIFLNKTGFRGVYREGPNGFNVPYGNYKNPKILDESELLELSKLLSGVEFVNSSFEHTLKNVVKGDFVYLDPPYVPETLKSFTGYVAGGFNKHKDLFDTCARFKELGVSFILSNSKTPLVIDYFSNESHYQVVEVECRRTINSKDPSARTTEVVIS